MAQNDPKMAQKSRDKTSKYGQKGVPKCPTYRTKKSENTLELTH